MPTHVTDSKKHNEWVIYMNEEMKYMQDTINRILNEYKKQDSANVTSQIKAILDQQEQLLADNPQLKQTMEPTLIRLKRLAQKSEISHSDVVALKFNLNAELKQAAELDRQKVKELKEETNQLEDIHSLLIKLDDINNQVAKAQSARSKPAKRQPRKR